MKPIRRYKFIHLLVLAGFLLSFLAPPAGAFTKDAPAGHPAGAVHADMSAGGGHGGMHGMHQKLPDDPPRMDCKHGCDYCVAACQPAQAAGFTGPRPRAVASYAGFTVRRDGIKSAHTGRIDRPPCG